MKKIMLFLLFTILLVTVVYAPDPNEETGSANAQGNAEPRVIATGPQEGNGQGQPEEVPGEQKQLRTQAQLHISLENALGRVENENARQRLQQNMERFQEHYQARLEGMEDVEVEEMDEETGGIHVSAREQVRFFGFIKGKARKRFMIDAEGNVEEKHPWYRFMYKEETQE